MSLLPDFEGLAMFAKATGERSFAGAARALGVSVATVWRFTNAAGEEVVIKPEEPLCVTNSDALLPTVLAGLANAEFPEFIAADHVRTGQLVPILEDSYLARGEIGRASCRERVL